MAKVKLDNVSKVYENGYEAVKNINLDIKDKEFIVLVGPSGCGKSTTLRMIAGLEDITSGDLIIDEARVNDISPKDRDIAMVFQSYALYPHMTIRENMGFALKMAKEDKKTIKSKVETIAKTLQLEDLLDRKPSQLSGGQRQRVALGRAMVRNPKVFLLDEPLSNLDAKLRVEMRTEIVNLHKKLDTTFIYVTHDQTEAMTMGDRIAVLNKGVLEQFDTPLNLYNKPRNRFIAEFIGSPKMNITDSALIAQGDSYFIELFGQRIRLADEKIADIKKAGIKDRILIGIRPEAFFYDKDSHIKIRPTNVEYMGSDTYAYAQNTAKEPYFVMRFDSEDPVYEGSDLGLGIDTEDLYLFDPSTDEAISHPINLRKDL